MNISESEHTITIGTLKTEVSTGGKSPGPDEIIAIYYIYSISCLIVV